MPADQKPGLLKASQILEMDSVVGNPGGRVQTKGIRPSGGSSNHETGDKNEAVSIADTFIPQGNVIGRSAGSLEDPVPLGDTYSFDSANTTTSVSNTPQANQGFLARVVCEAIDANNPATGEGLPEMAEVGDGVLIYLLNRYAGYDEFLADPMLHTSGAPRYKLDSSYPTPMIGGDETAEPPELPTPSPPLTDEEIHNNRKSTYLYQFIECVFDDIKNNPYVAETGVTDTGAVSEDVVTEKDFLSCADLKVTCLECIQSVLDVRGWNTKLEPGDGGQGIKNAQSPCDGKMFILDEEDKSEVSDYIKLLMLAPGDAINKVIDNAGAADNDGSLPQKCVPPIDPGPDGSGAACSDIQPYLDNHLQADVAGKLGEEGLLYPVFMEAICPALKLGYFIMPLPPIAAAGIFELTLPLAVMAWFESLPDDALPGSKEFPPQMGPGSTDSPGPPTAPPGFTVPGGPKEASAAEGFKPNTKTQVMAAYMNLAHCLGKDLDRDVVPALLDGSIKLLSLSVPSPIVPWAEITELEKCTLGGGRELGPHMAHATLEWAVDQIHIVDLRILAIPVAVGPPPYVGLMGSIPPPGSVPKEPPPGHPKSEQTPGVPLEAPIGMGA